MNERLTSAVLSCISARGLFLTASLAFAPPAVQAQSPDFRGASVSWAPTGTPNEVVFHVNYAARLSQSNVPATTNSIGGTYSTAAFYFVDFANNVYGGTRLVVRVTAVNFDEDWYQGTADITYTYPGPGQYVFGLFGSNVLNPGGDARILNLWDRSGTNYMVQTLVNPASGNHSPTNNLGLVVYVPQSATTTFTVPARDPDGDRIRWRLSTDAEAGGGFGPPNLSINPTNGIVSWNNAALNLGNWTAQVIVEDLDAKGNVKTQNPVDFVLTLVSNTVPAVQVSPTNSFSTSPGSSVTFQVSGLNADLGDTVTLTASGLPATALLSPSLPVIGTATANSTFFWTPGFADLGVHTITFIATDSTGLQSSTTVTLNVVDNNPPISVSLPPPIQVESVSPGGTPVPLTANLTNIYGAPTTVQWSVDGTLVQSGAVTPVAVGTAPPSAQATLAYSYGLGQHSVSVTAADGLRPSATTMTYVTVVDTTPPTILSCPPDQTLTLDPVSRSVTVPDLTRQVVATDNGTAAGALGVTQIPLAGTVVYQSGPLTITFTVRDASGNSSQCQTVWTLIDNSIPQVFASLVTASLWPPNHDLICVGFRYHANKPIAGQMIQVYSNEPDIPAGVGDTSGDDRFSPDAVDLVSGDVVLRSERLGGGPGRVYLIVATVVDALGSIAFDDKTVVVPASQNAVDVAGVNLLAATADAWFRQHGAPPPGYVLVGVGPVVGPKQTAVGPCPLQPE